MRSSMHCTHASQQRHTHTHTFLHPPTYRPFCCCVGQLLATTSYFFDTTMEIFAFAGRELGIFLAGPFNLCAMFATGMYFNGDQIIWPFRITYYVLPAHWCFGGLVSTVFRESHDFTGATASKDADGPRFVCEGGGDTTTTCFGVTGRDILESLHDRYSVVEPEVQVGVHLGWIFLMIVVARLLLLACYTLRAIPAKGRTQVSETQANESTSLLSSSQPNDT